jgi:hypothetical protein
MNELNELSSEGWSQVNDSRANPDADLDYYVMLSLEIMAHCDASTDEELEIIALRIEAAFDDHRAAVMAIRSGEIVFEQIGDLCFFLVPATTPTQRVIDIKEAMASLEKKGAIVDTGETRWGETSGEFQSVYKLAPKKYGCQSFP